MNRIYKGIFALLIIVTLLSCENNEDLEDCGQLMTIMGNEDFVTEEFDLESFSKLIVSGKIDVNISFGETNQLKVMVESNILSYMDIFLQDNGLYVKMNGQYCYSIAKNVSLDIEMPSLEYLSITGESMVRIEEVRSSINLLEILTTGNVEISIQNQSSIENLSIEAKGKSVFDGFNLETKNSAIKATGQVLHNLSVSENLKVNISGMGIIKYLGSPQIEESTKGDVTIIKVG